MMTIAISIDIVQHQQQFSSVSSVGCCQFFFSIFFSLCLPYAVLSPQPGKYCRLCRRFSLMLLLLLYQILASFISALSLFFRNSLFFFFRLLFSVFIFKTTTHTQRHGRRCLCCASVLYSSVRRDDTNRWLAGWLAGKDSQNWVQFWVQNERKKKENGDDDDEQKFSCPSHHPPPKNCTTFCLNFVGWQTQ